LRVALDTNILAYAEGVNGLARKKEALDILERLPVGSILVPVQALGELFSLLVRKAGRTPKDARAAVLQWRNAFTLVDTSGDVLLAATDLAVKQFSIWDAVMVCAAAEGDCRLLLSEDMQDGFVWKGLTIANPFAEPRHPLLEALLGAEDR
jgi:predicted nucleic acid-binding protein